MAGIKEKGKAFMEKMLELPNVTLAAMTSVKLYETVKALEYSMQGIHFGEVVLITHRKPLFLPKGITYRHTDKLTDIDCFNYKIAYELGDYIHTDYVLLVHYDGFVVHPEKWRRVGNSVSLRSKRLLEFPRKADLKWEKDEEGFFNEDIFLCCRHKHDIEAAGMQIAPIEVAKYFSHEHPIPEIADVDAPFVFHKWWGRNEQYPKFQNPWTRRWMKLKELIRPLLFWRHAGR